MENKDGKALKTLRNTCDLPQSEVLVSETGKEVNNGAAAAAESSKAKLRPDMPIWWSNGELTESLTNPRSRLNRVSAIFFCSMHCRFPPRSRMNLECPLTLRLEVMGLIGVLFLRPWSTLDYRTAWLCFASWQLATYGITMGYHREFASSRCIRKR